MKKDNAYLLLVITIIIWSLSGLLVKSVKAGPLWIMLIRSLSGGIFLLPYVFKEKIYPMKNVFFAGFFMAVFLLALTITIKISSSAMAISMQYTAPIYVIGYSMYKNKKIVPSKFIVFLLIFLGIIFNSISNLNNVLAIFTGIIVGLGFVFYSYNLQKVKSGNPLGIVAITNIVSSVFYALALIFNHKLPPTSMTELSVIIIAGILISGVSYALYRESLKSIPMEKALIICLAEPILNPIWVYLGNGEIPAFTTVIGVSLILLGAILDILFDSKKTKKKNISKIK